MMKFKQVIYGFVVAAFLSTFICASIYGTTYDPVIGLTIIPGPTTHYTNISSVYGPRNISKGSTFHKGIDFSADFQPVYHVDDAKASVMITEISYNPDPQIAWGYYIIIDEYSYLHLKPHSNTSPYGVFPIIYKDNLNNWHVRNGAWGVAVDDYAGLTCQDEFLANLRWFFLNLPFCNMDPYCRQLTA